jgi:hypothetical protein
MPQNKRHHYVPRFYLKRFTDDERFINLYNLKAEKKITNAKLKNQCYQNYLYGKDRPVEKSLAHIETGASQLFRKIDHYQRPPPPGTEDQYLMLVYLMMQRGRTIHAADTINEMFDKMTKETWGDYFMQKDGIDLNDFEIGIEDSANYALGLSMTMYPLLFDMHYKLLVNKASVEFITSDHPVVTIKSPLKSPAHRTCTSSTPCRCARQWTMSISMIPLSTWKRCTGRRVRICGQSEPW